MLLFKKLDLPCPITRQALDCLLEKKTSYKIVSLDLENLLSIEAKDYFKSLNVFPNVAILFGHFGDSSKHKLDPHIHSDIFLKENRWVRCPFAINFEITDTVATIKWWDSRGLAELSADPISKGIEHDYGNGIHYGSVRNSNTNEFDLLGECPLDSQQAVLIKTDIPHCVYYNEGFESRLSISLRFPIEQIPTFEKAANLF